jgi:hypothetical protein
VSPKLSWFPLARRQEDDPLLCPIRERSERDRQAAGGLLTRQNELILTVSNSLQWQFFKSQPSKVASHWNERRVFNELKPSRYQPQVCGKPSDQAAKNRAQVRKDAEADRKQRRGAA